ncbi:hypothetical protein ACQJBY_070834 [Aegilops geniculata]
MARHRPSTDIPACIKEENDDEGTIAIPRRIRFLYPESMYRNFAVSITKRRLVHMRVCEAWVDMNGEFPREIQLWTERCAWGVELVKDGDFLHLKKGWRGFAEEHGVKVGDVVHFQMVTPSAWVLRIKAPNGEIRRPRSH